MSTTPLVVPNAIYFDANALIAAPWSFLAEPIADAIEAAKRFKANLFVPELAVEEWIAHRCEDAHKGIQRIDSDTKSLAVTLGREALHWDAVSREDVVAAVRAAVLNRLQKLGFEIISTPKIELAEILELFLKKVPPFNSGDKGFKDAIVLETIFQHACRDNKHGHIIVVSSDAVFRHSAIATRFRAARTTLNVVTGKPEELFANLADTLHGMFGEAISAIIHREREKAMTFAKQHELDILRFASEHARMSMSDLLGYGLGQWGREKDDTDDKLKLARIVSIDAVRPVRVESAHVYPEHDREPADGRVAFLITVALEIDLTIEKSNVFDEPRVAVNNVSALLEGGLTWEHPKVRDSLTVRRKTAVVGSIAAEGADSGDFQDLRLESA